MKAWYEDIDMEAATPKPTPSPDRTSLESVMDTGAQSILCTYISKTSASANANCCGASSYVGAAVERVAPICLACQRLSTCLVALLGLFSYCSELLGSIAPGFSTADWSVGWSVLVGHWQLHAAHVLSKLKDDKST